MLAIRNITPNAYSYTGLNRNVKSNQPQDANNVNFTGDSNQKNSKVAKRVGVGLIAVLSALGLYNCSDDSDKYHDVYISYPGAPKNAPLDTIKMEDNCSFEVIHTKYVMHEGKLWAYDKDRHEWYEAPDSVMVIRESQEDHLEEIASASEEKKGVTILSKDDIKHVQKNNEDFEYNYGNYYDPMGNLGYRFIESGGNKLLLMVNGGYYHGSYDLVLSYDADKDLDFKYGMKYKDASPEEIAKDLSKQISGYSDNDETIAMFNAIPNSKLKDVARAYRKNNSHGLLEDFGREFMVDRKEVCDLAKRMKEPSSDKRYYELYVKVYNPDRRDIWDYAELKEMDDIICAEDND